MKFNIFVQVMKQFFGATESTNKIVVMDGWLERVKEENASQMDSMSPLDMSLDNLAYTVYSSGTTGKPKGRLYFGQDF